MTLSPRQVAAYLEIAEELDRKIEKAQKELSG